MKVASRPVAAPIEIPLINEVLYEDDQGGQVTANGNIFVTPDFFFHVKVSGATIENLTFENKTLIDANITVFSGVEYTVHENIVVYEKNLPPFSVPGLSLIVITPRIVVSVGLDGRVSSGITWGATYTNNAEVSAIWENDAWSIPRNSVSDITLIPLEFKTTLSAKIYARPRLELLFWGAVGPYAQVDGYFRLNASPQDNPWWTLDLGIDAVIGLRIEVFGLIELNPIHEEFSIYHKTVAQAPLDQPPAPEPPPEPPEPDEPDAPSGGDDSPPGGEDTPSEPPPPPAPTGNENVRIVYDNTSAFAINISQGSVAVKGLVFNRIDNQGDVTASYQADIWGNFYSDYDPVPANYCLRIALPNSSTAPDCIVQVNYETSQEKYHFWKETSNSRQFQVLKNNSLIQTCEISAGSCTFYLPQP